MSLVNAFINQIGRELAHDVYRNAQLKIITNGRNQKKLTLMSPF